MYLSFGIYHSLDIVFWYDYMCLSFGIYHSLDIVFWYYYNVPFFWDLSFLRHCILILLQCTFLLGFFILKTLYSDITTMYLSFGICVLFIFLMVTDTSWIQSQPRKLSANFGLGAVEVRASFTLLGGIKMSLSNADFITIIFWVEELDADFLLIS